MEKAALRVPRKIRFGSDFSGMDGWLVALKRLKVDIVHEFSSDTAPACRKYIQRAHQPKVCFRSVLDRTPEQEEYTDLYTWSPPCQDFSVAGKSAGLEGSRRVGQLVKASLLYIKRKRPRVTLFENVPTLASYKKFRPFTKGLVKCLGDLGYEVHSKVLDSQHFGSAQVRRRLFVVAFRKDSVRHKFAWPTPLAVSARVQDVLDPTCPSDKAGRLPKDARGRARAVAAYRKVHVNGIDPLVTPVVVDIDCSPNFQTFGIDIAKTITRTRALAGGPWISTRGRRTTVTELMALQGFERDDVPFAEAGISSVQIRGMLGNAVNVHTVGYLLASALYAGGLTSSRLQYHPAAPARVA
jgi:DNA-cytosine methyltransferase